MQGELERGTSSHAYRGFRHGFVTIAQQEGIFALQNGLSAALLFNATTNGVRLAMYAQLKPLFSSENDQGWDGGASLSPSVLAGRATAAVTAGAIGGAVGSPFYLVKARLQVQSCFFSTKTRHPWYRGTMHALQHIVKQQGWWGLTTGMWAQTLRISIGGGTQLMTYDLTKTVAVNQGWAQADSMALHAVCSIAAGAGVVVVATPADVVTSRMYVSDLYRNTWDCVTSIVREEGAASLYRGAIPRFFRIAPHTILTFVFFEQARRLVTH